MTGVWLDFPGWQVTTFWWPDEITCAIRSGWALEGLFVWVSTQASNGLFEGGTVTLATGGLAEIGNVSDAAFVVTNTTCAEYFVRVEVHVARPMGAAPAGACDTCPPQAGASEASSDDGGGEPGAD
jgi:hypothetical protein